LRKNTFDFVEMASPCGRGPEEWAVMSVVSNPGADRFALWLRSLTRALLAVYYGVRIAASVSIAL
jgi:hypothetical protein